jgi:hypothetical protein
LAAILIFSAILCFFAPIYFFNFFLWLQLPKYIIRFTLNSIASGTVFYYNCSASIYNELSKQLSKLLKFLAKKFHAAKKNFIWKIYTKIQFFCMVLGMLHRSFLYKKVRIGKYDNLPWSWKNAKKQCFQ